MEEVKLTYEHRLVAFIDILGFKEIVKQSETDPRKLDLLQGVLNYLKEWEVSSRWGADLIEIEEDAQRKRIEKFDIRGRTNSTSFSDSIVVSVKVNDDVNEMTSTLIANLAYIGAIMLEEGILFRGGITIGNIVHKENGIVFGQALVDAYQLESKSAKFPRIIISERLIRELNYPYESKRERFPYHQYLNRFEDGCVGFHQMSYYQVMQSWTQMTKDKLTVSLANVRKVIVSGLDSNFENTEVFQKYRWLKEQYNDLLILRDRTTENVKLKIRDLNDGIPGTNIHFSHTDNFYSNSGQKA